MGGGPAGKCQTCNRLAIVAIEAAERSIQMKSNINNYLQNAMFSAFLMNNLVSDLLDLAKLQNNAFQLNLGEFNLIQAVQDVFSIVCFQAENKQIKLRLKANMDQAQIFQRLIGDHRRIIQILLNFISNSLKFTKSEDGIISIQLRLLDEQIAEEESMNGEKSSKSVQRFKRQKS